MAEATGKVESSKRWLIYHHSKRILLVPVVSACDKNNMILCFLSFSPLYLSSSLIWFISFKLYLESI